MHTIRRSKGWFRVIALSVVAAACSGREAPTSVQTLNPPPNDWVTKASMPTARFIAGSAVANGLMYVVGGRNNVNLNNKSVADTILEAYDPSADRWTTLAPLPTHRYDVAAGSVNGIIYAVGGWGFPNPGPCCYMNLLEAYDPSSDSWTTKAPLPIARTGMSVGVVNGILYVVGGLTPAVGEGGGLESRVDAYDPSTNSWTAKAPMSVARNGVGIADVNGVLYVIGGVNFSGALDLVEAYDPAANTWTTKAPMPTARYGLALGVVNGIIYAVGGRGGPSWEYLTTVEAYDPATDSWTTKPSMSLPRYFLNVAGIGDHLYAVGGGVTSDSTGFDTVYRLVEEFTP